MGLLQCILIIKNRDIIIREKLVKGIKSRIASFVNCKYDWLMDVASGHLSDLMVCLTLSLKFKLFKLIYSIK